MASSKSSVTTPIKASTATSGAYGSASSVAPAAVPDMRYFAELFKATSDIPTKVIDMVGERAGRLDGKCPSGAMKMALNWFPMRDKMDPVAAVAVMEGVDEYQSLAKGCGYTPLSLEDMITMYGAYCLVIAASSPDEADRRVASAANDAAISVRTSLEVMGEVYRRGKALTHMAVVHYTTALRGVFKHLMAIKVLNRTTAGDVRVAQVDIMRTVLDIITDDEIKKRLSDELRARLVLAKRVSFGGARTRTRNARNRRHRRHNSRSGRGCGRSRSRSRRQRTTRR